jgi:hypothetical protein
MRIADLARSKKTTAESGNYPLKITSFRVMSTVLPFSLSHTPDRDKTRILVAEDRNGHLRNQIVENP